MSSLSIKKFGEGYLFIFLVCIITAAVLYTPFLIIDKGPVSYTHLTLPTKLEV